VQVGTLTVRAEPRPRRVQRLVVRQDLDAALRRVAHDLAPSARNHDRLAHASSMPATAPRKSVLRSNTKKAWTTFALRASLVCSKGSLPAMLRPLGRSWTAVPRSPFRRTSRTSARRSQPPRYCSSTKASAFSASLCRAELVRSSRARPGPDGSCSRPRQRRSCSGWCKPG
jgi:hypothetical protein